MAKITIKLAPLELRRELVFKLDIEDTVRRNLPAYTECAPWDLAGFEGADAAEEAFEVTNDPSRDDERVRVHGRQASISTGDVVSVDGINWLCCSVGWKQL